jgi:hypothetical protein
VASALATSSLSTSNGIEWIVAGHRRGIRDRPQRLGVVGAEPDLGQCVRQTYPRGQFDEVANVGRRRTFENEPGERADIDLLAVRQAVRRPD